jgi:hypothetical protein
MAEQSMQLQTVNSILLIMNSLGAEERKKILEEYNDWKGNAPLLYDMVLSYNLTWPTLTCQWLPKRTL